MSRIAPEFLAVSDQLAAVGRNASFYGVNDAASVLRCSTWLAMCAKAFEAREPLPAMLLLNGLPETTMRDTSAVSEVAKAWHDAWLADSEGDAAGPPDLCEGCSLPATTTDGSDERTPLCDACGKDCEREWERQALEVLRAIGKLAPGETVPDTLRHRAIDLGGDR